MPFVETNGVRLYYEDEGAGRPLVMIMGLSAQYLWWPRSLVDALLERGFRVIRFDNRDIGASSRLTHLGNPDVRTLTVRALFGGPVEAPYRLEDMAEDTLGLIRHLGLERAHIMGASMGGMIAQRLALLHPEVVESLTLVFTSTNSRRDGLPTRRGLRMLLRKPPQTRQETADRFASVGRVLNGRGYPYDEAYWRALGEACFDHSDGPPGSARQMAAVLGSGSTRERLVEIEAPTLVLHGTDDPLVRVLGGINIARRIRNSRLMVLRGMGHHLPRALHTTVAANVEALATGSA